MAMLPKTTTGIFGAFHRQGAGRLLIQTAKMSLNSDSRFEFGREMHLNWVNQLKHSQKTARLNKFLLYGLGLPAIVAVGIYSYYEHVEEENHELPPMKLYPYLYIQTNPYPWGDGKHSFFFNPDRQYIPDASPNGFCHCEKCMKWRKKKHSHHHCEYCPADWKPAPKKHGGHAEEPVKKENARL